MNILDSKVLSDGYKHVTIKLSGVLDTSDVAEFPAVELDALSGGSPTQTLVGLKVSRMDWSVSNGLQILLNWDSLQPQQIFPVAGQGEVCFPGGLQPDMTRPEYNGNITLATQGFTVDSVNTFSILLTLEKKFS